MKYLVKVLVDRWMESAPSPSWSAGVRVVENCGLLDVFERQVTDIGSVQRSYSFQRTDGSKRRSSRPDAAFWDGARRLAENGELWNVAAYADLKRDGSVWSMVSFVFPYSEEMGDWYPGYASLSAKIRVPLPNDGVPSEVFDCAVEFMSGAAVAIDASWGCTFDEPWRWRAPDLREYARGPGPQSSDGEPDSIVGVAPVFLVGPTPLSRMGGFDQVAAEAPAYSVSKVEYRDGRVGAVVRVGVDDRDLDARIDAVSTYFRPFIAPPR